MEERRKNKRIYFNELAATSLKYILPYVSGFKDIGPGMDVMEIGCGEGGNLLPFARKGCRVFGVDLSEGKIRDAVQFFGEEGAEGNFVASDIFLMKELEGRFSLILCHDVVEHISDKEEFLRRMNDFLTPDGVIFMAFPAWQMPFGGHQQVCRSRILSRLPYFHLLPSSWYRRILEKGGEDPAAIKELMEIKQTGTTVELFERLSAKAGFTVADRRLYLINPHYEVKFGLKPRRLNRLMANIPCLRNFFATSCFYILKKNTTLQQNNA